MLYTNLVVPCAVQRDSGAPQTRNPEGVDSPSLGVPALRFAAAGTTTGL